MTVKKFCIKHISAYACLLCSLVGCVLMSCNSEYKQKPRGYFKIDFPEKKYQVFNEPGYPYSFEYPVYGRIEKDSLFFEERTENPYWVNIVFPRFDGRIHITYKEIGKHKLDSLIKDAFTLSYKQHTEVASQIDRDEFATPSNVHGVFFTLKGNAATPNQFFATDSARHFLRGALYFSTTPNADSMAPVNQFFKEDLLHLIHTLKWK